MGQELEKRGEEPGLLAEVLPPPTMADLTWDPEKAAAVCWWITEGTGLDDACGLEGLKPRVFKYWLLRRPELEGMYRAARRMAAWSEFDKAISAVKTLLRRKTKATQTEVRAVDVATTALLRAAEVLNPGELSNRQPVGPGLNVRIVTTLNLKPGGSPPGGDQSDVYTIHQKVMGTVIEAQEPDAGGKRKPFEEPEQRVFEMEVKDVGQGGGEG